MQQHMHIATERIAIVSFFGSFASVDEGRGAVPRPSYYGSAEGAASSALDQRACSQGSSGLPKWP